MSILKFFSLPEFQKLFQKWKKDKISLEDYKKELQIIKINFLEREKELKKVKQPEKKRPS